MRLPRVDVKSEGKSRFAGGGVAVLAWSFILVGLGLACWSVVLLLHEPGPVPIAQAKTPDFSQPSKLPSAPSKKQVGLYSVAPTLPKYINIPTIGVPDTEVRAFGLLASGQIAVPSSSYVTGWYAGSSKPGEPGAMFIYGHVMGWYTGGILYNLKNLNPGDRITVTRGDDTRYTYQVVTRKIYPRSQVDMQQVLSPVTPGVPGLNLMTCTGQLLKDPTDFSERLVVYASLVKG